MILPYHLDVPMQKLPIANWLLIVFTCLITLGDWVWFPEKADLDNARRIIEIHQLGTKASKTPQDVERLSKLINELKFERSKEVTPLATHPEAWRPWQPVTSMFVHGDLGHLLGNMFFLFLFGNAINAKLNHFLFLMCYLALGIVSDFVRVGLQYAAGDLTPSLGASGAIMGIAGLCLVFYPRNDARIFYVQIPFGIGVLTISSGWLVLFYLVCDLLGNIFYLHDGIGYMAHLSGCLAGILLGILLIQTGWVELEYGEENLLQIMGMQKKLKRWE
ncbi:MAG: rhomboid family intramembrane serine protease [Planctomycetia bacterium]|nr:rhomboid family intramembrane serine protease [Planctomycetia bacterium]